MWTIATEPLNVPDSLGVDHFAAFPSEWPLRLIRGWSPAGICSACGEGRRPVSDAARTLNGAPISGAAWAKSKASEPHGARNAFETVRSITGYNCACFDHARSSNPLGPCHFCAGNHEYAPTRPAVVLDPFGGTGTTALCASVLGRIGISVDLSHDYSRLAAWRTTDPGQRAKAMRVEKPPVQLDGQIDMFGDVA